MKRCPKCGGTEFRITCHVTQDWLVGPDGDYWETLEPYIETIHQADDDDIWECYKCGFDAAGREFNVKEDV